LYLLDTNTLIYFFKNLGNVSEILLSKSPKEIAIPAITLYELEVGIAKSKNPQKRRKQLNEFVSQVAVFQFGAKEAAIAALVRANLERKGTPIGPYDTLIAGIALSTKSTLVTHNTKEFKRIKKLNIEDWFKG
jgi:tRNA(fMet)-specific endonuclease VapC